MSQDADVATVANPVNPAPRKSGPSSPARRFLHRSRRLDTDASVRRSPPSVPRVPSPHPRETCSRVAHDYTRSCGIALADGPPTCVARGGCRAPVSVIGHSPVDVNQAGLFFLQRGPPALRVVGPRFRLRTQLCCGSTEEASDPARSRSIAGAGHMASATRYRSLEHCAPSRRCSPHLARRAACPLGLGTRGSSSLSMARRVMKPATRRIAAYDRGRPVRSRTRGS